MINVQFMLTKVYIPMYVMKSHSMSCIIVSYVYVVLLCCGFIFHFFVFLHILMLCCVVIFYLSSKVISYADIPLSSDILF